MLEKNKVLDFARNRDLGPVAFALITLLSGIVGTYTYRELALADIEHSYRRELAFIDSMSRTNLLPIQLEMQRIAQDFADDSEIELFCVDNDGNTAHTDSFHKKHPLRDDSIITIDYELCASIDYVSRENFHPINSDPTQEISGSAGWGVFVLSHEIGHRVLGSNEDYADCYANMHYRDIAKNLGMPITIIESPTIIKPDSC